MAYALGNGISATWTPTPIGDPPPDPPVVLAFAVTGFSWDGGDRPEVDITTGASTRRKVLPGLASQETFTLSVKYDTGDEALLSNPYSPEMIKCGSGTLVVNMPTTDNCTVLVEVMAASQVDLISFDFSVELDGVLEGEVQFRRRHVAI